MRVGIIADTHGFLDPRIAEQLAACDVAVHAGDIGGAEVLCAMQPREEVYAVRGNVDGPQTWPDHEGHMLENLPGQLMLDLPGGQLAVLHGDSYNSSQRHAQLRESLAETRAIACGHSHELVVDDDKYPWILNPGAAGRVRVGDGPSMLILVCDEQHWEVETHRFPPRKYRAISGVNGD
ncbi:metallophosphoesterase family protein [Halorhodospira halochloris]|nr:metallophosphoesterase family protein [Halorhodospira halochloris]MBK1651246.1 YfcE family phosphodiesterase [Halorhodospira halochloris]